MQRENKQGSAGGDGYTNPVHLPPTGQNGYGEIIGCHCNKCMQREKKQHNKKHLVYSDGKTLMYDNHCDACLEPISPLDENTKEVQREKKCRDCNGTGKSYTFNLQEGQEPDDCFDCKGTGEIENKWQDRFLKFIRLLNEKHEWCIGHSEGQHCHLDNEPDNNENIVPDLLAFIQSELKAREEEIKESFIKEFFGSGERWYNYGFSDDEEREIAIKEVEGEWEDIINNIK